MPRISRSTHGRFDAVVASNLFRDILSDLGPALTWTTGIAPSGNINPEGTHHSLFESVHGSAPNIAGMVISNPVGQIWADAMMLGFLGEFEAEAAAPRAIEETLKALAGRTRDLGGTLSPQEAGTAIAGNL